MKELTDDQCVILVLRGQVTDLESQVTKLEAELDERRKIDLQNCLRAEVERLRAELDQAIKERDDYDNDRCAWATSLAAANELLARSVKYAREDNARTPGTTRLARALDEATAHLAATAYRNQAGDIIDGKTEAPGPKPATEPKK